MRSRSFKTFRSEVNLNSRWGKFNSFKDRAVGGILGVKKARGILDNCYNSRAGLEKIGAVHSHDESRTFLLVLEANISQPSIYPAINNKETDEFPIGGIKFSTQISPKVSERTRLLFPPLNARHVFVLFKNKNWMELYLYLLKIEFKDKSKIGSKTLTDDSKPNN